MTEESGLGGGFSFKPNSSMEKLDKSREEEIRSDERAKIGREMAMQEIAANEKAIAENNAAMKGYSDGFREGGLGAIAGLTGPGRPVQSNEFGSMNTESNLDDYIIRGISTGEMHPSEAINALESGKLSPDVAKLVAETLNIPLKDPAESGLGGTIPR